jgi:hypothetical protein
MGSFGFLSKAHSDQSLVSGDVMAKISVYDEKIKTSRENIDANRKALKQLDDAVDQVMARSDSEKGADKAVAIRRGQQKERARLLSEIQSEQKTIGQLSEERSPIAAEVRKVEAEVGPIKYIAAFVYGSTDSTILEKAVTWVIILIIVVFDPLAVILLLSSQISFQNFRERTKGGVLIDSSGTIVGLRNAEGNSPRGTTEVIDTKPPAVTEQEETTEGDSPEKESDVVSTATVTTILEVIEPILCNKCDTKLVDVPGIGLYCPNIDCSALDEWALEDVEYEKDNGALTNNQIEQIKETIIFPESIVNKPSVSTVSTDGEYAHVNDQTYHKNSVPIDYVQNEEQKESSIWSNAVGATISREEYFKTSQTKLEDYVDEIVELVKDGKIQLFELHEPLLTQVKVKL